MGVDGRWPAKVVGLPVLVLDESTETFRYDTTNYLMLPPANPPKPGQRWWFAYARTLPGWPTRSEDYRL
jgi:hypothetical protein